MGLRDTPKIPWYLYEVNHNRPLLDEPRLMETTDRLGRCDPYCTCR
jgi:hypothetical protein